MQDIIEIELEDLEDNAPLVARTVSTDVASRKSYQERRAFERFDEVITKVETMPKMADLVSGVA